MAYWPRFLPIVLSLALLACGGQTDDPTRSSAPASTPVPTRSPEIMLSKQDVLLRHCIESEMRRGSISLSEGVDALSNLDLIRDPGDPYRLGLIVQCSELGYLEEVVKEDFKEPTTPAPSSKSATSIPTLKATWTPVPTAIVPIPLPTPTPIPTPHPLPAELTSGVNALVHCAGESVEYWLEHGPPTLTADLVGCLNSYLEQVGG